MNSKQNKIEEEFCLQLLLLNSSFDILGFRIWYSPITLICDDYNFKEVKYMLFKYTLCITNNNY